MYAKNNKKQKVQVDKVTLKALKSLEDLHLYFSDADDGPEITAGLDALQVAYNCIANSVGAPVINFGEGTDTVAEFVFKYVKN